MQYINLILHPKQLSNTFKVGGYTIIILKYVANRRIPYKLPNFIMTRNGIRLNMA